MKKDAHFTAAKLTQNGQASGAAVLYRRAFRVCKLHAFKNTAIFGG